MKIKTVSENQLPDHYYEPPRLSRWGWIALGIVPLLLGLVINFPIKAKLEKLVKDGMEVLPCQIEYSSLRWEFFLPKMVLENPSLPGTCLNNPRKNLDLSFLQFKFRGPGIFPPGVKFLVSTQFKKSEINVHHTLAFNKQIFKVEKTNLDLSDWSSQFNLPPIGGVVEVTSLVEVNKAGTITALDLLAKSKDLIVQSFSAHGLQIPMLPLGNFLIKASNFKASKMDLTEIVLGNDKSPIMAQFKGSLNLNLEEVGASYLQIAGGVKFSEAFLKEFAILNLFLQKYHQKEGFYQMRIHGPLDNPMFSPL